MKLICMAFYGAYFKGEQICLKRERVFEVCTKANYLISHSVMDKANEHMVGALSFWYKKKER